MRSFVPFLCLFAVTSLAGCGTSSAPASSPLSTAAVYPPGTIEGRISSLETRVEGLQSQINQMNEKWSVAQSKLTDAAMALRALDPASAIPMPPMHQAASPQTGLYTPEKTAGTQSAAPIIPAMKPAIHETMKPKPVPVQMAPHVPAAKPILPLSLKKPSKAESIAIATTAASTAAPASTAPVPAKSAAPTPATFEPMESDQTPVPAPAPVPAKKTSPMLSNMSGITSIRVGDYPDKTRLVMDVSAPTTFTYDIDNAERILIITTSARASSAPMQGAFTTSPLVSAYSAEKTADGSVRLVLQLRAGVKVAKAQTLAPSEGKGNRIMFDLVPGS